MERLIEIIIFQDRNGHEPFVEWIESIKNVNIVRRIYSRLDRLESGNLGDYKSVGEKVYELRLFFGKGYRIYFGKIERKIVVLLCGGDKDTQARDIKKAQNYWKKFKEINNENIS